jgi:flagellar biogenesis protein FliO
VLLLQSSPPPIPETSLWLSFFKVFGMLGLLLFGAFLLLRYLGRRVGGLREHSSGGRLEVVDRLGLEPRRSVYVLRIGSRYVAVASTEAGMQVLMEIPPDPAATPTSSVERGQPT